MSKTIEISVHERIQVVRINRPEKKNALDLAMYQSLAGALKTADADSDIRVVYLSASGDAFCSGNDIKDFLKSPPEDDNSPVIRFVNTIINMEKPIVAAVNGLAIGIGTTMLLHCDFVYAADNARFQLPFVNIGLCPEAGSTFVLPALMGHQRAAELLLLGNMFDAKTARDAGFVNKIVPVSDLEEEALAAARQIAAQPPNATKVTKGLLRAAMKELTIAAVKRENENFVPMLKGAEATEALNAFMEKRAPDFSRYQDG